MWSLSVVSNNRARENFLVAPRSVFGRPLQSQQSQQQRKSVLFRHSGRRVGSRHISTVSTIERFVHARLRVQILWQLFEICGCKEQDGHLCAGGCPQFGRSDGGSQIIFVETSVQQEQHN